jgi:hypothetical protein
MRYRNKIDYLASGEFNDIDDVADKDNVESVIDDIEGDVIAIRKKLEVIQGLDLIDEVVIDLKELEDKLY